MPRYTDWLSNGMKSRGHNVQVWHPKPRLFNFPALPALRKWLGYADQYIIFPLELRNRLKKQPHDTIYVFTDHALGPWVPLVAKLPHVIHCHDFLAQRSALGEIRENPTAWSGRKYQSFIRKGYSEGRHFISISKKTKDDLHVSLLGESPITSRVVYNGLAQPFSPASSNIELCLLEEKLGIELKAGYILNVAGNQWYKNRDGVIEIYSTWRQSTSLVQPLLMVGAKPSAKIKMAFENSDFKEDIHFLSNLADDLVRIAYKHATVFLFPSLAEGFGWPIAEAMASGTMVITTDEAPMNEVGADAAFYINRKPSDSQNVDEWLRSCMQVLEEVVSLKEINKQQVVQKGLSNAERFNSDRALDEIENIYIEIIDKYK